MFLYRIKYGVNFHELMKTRKILHDNLSETLIQANTFYFWHIYAFGILI